MRVVLDTNVLISGIFFGGIPGQVLDSWMDEKFGVYVTPKILNEYLRVIEEIGSKNLAISQYWNELLPEICHIIPDSRVLRQISRDSTDDKFIVCALNAKAHYLVSGDRDLRSLRQQFSFKIIEPKEFIKLLP